MSDKSKSVFEEMAEGTFAATTPAAVQPAAQPVAQAAKPVVRVVKAEAAPAAAPIQQVAQQQNYVPMDAFMKFVELLTAREVREETKLQLELEGSKAREKQRN